MATIVVDPDNEASILDHVISEDISVARKIISRKGDSFALDFTVKNADETPYDFTDHIVILDVYKSEVHPNPLLSFVIGSGITLSSGLISLSKSADLMYVLKGNLIYFLRVTFPNGTKKTWLQGPWIVNGGVYYGNNEEDQNPDNPIIYITVTGGGGGGTQDLEGVLTQGNEAGAFDIIHDSGYGPDVKSVVSVNASSEDVFANSTSVFANAELVEATLHEGKSASIIKFGKSGSGFTTFLFPKEDGTWAKVYIDNSNQLQILPS
jgi:hypothetical protein